MEGYAILGFSLWVGSIILAYCVGHSKDAGQDAVVAAVVFGPLGLLAALGFDGRPRCPRCAGRLDGRGEICQHCRTPLFWNQGVFGPEVSLDPPAPAPAPIAPDPPVAVRPAPVRAKEFPTAPEAPPRPMFHGRRLP
jgi:hypothetical protein